MARIQLDFPEPVLFNEQMRIGIADINYGNHLGNDRVLTLSHELRLRYLKSLGYRDELDFPEDRGTIVADAAIVYKSEGFYGDEITGSIGIDEVHSRGFDMYYRFTRNEDQKEIALAKTAILFFNYKERKLASIPEGLLEKMGIK